MCAIFCVTTIATAQNTNKPVDFSIEAPEKVKRDSTFEINTIFSTKGDWYIYAPTGVNESQGMIETKITFNLPNGIEKVDNLSMPAPRPKGMYQVYAGDYIPMSQQFKVSKELKSGVYDIECHILYQTCNNDICLPPYRETVIKTIQIQ